jgi:shikimate kinase
MPSFRHLVLIGLSGSGKSTVGRLLAVRLDLDFVDTDELIVSREGRSIPDIFAHSGEEAFRECERRAVASAVDGPPAVIATGGGAPIDGRNRAALWEGNAVVWLDAPVAVLAARVGAAGGRPLLAGGAEARLAQLRAAREPLYALAHLRVQTGNRSPESVAIEIESALASVAGGSERGG